MSIVVEEHILERNPEFAKLFQHLTTSLLNTDGSTKNHPEGKDRAATEKSLEKHRQRAIKHHLIEHALRTVSDAAGPQSQSSPSSSSSSLPASRTLRPANRLQQRRAQSLSPTDPLPEPLLDLVLTLPPFLDAAHALPHDAVALLLSSSPLADLPSLLPDLADLVSAALHAAALGLARLTHPSTNPTFLHRHVAALPQDLADLKDRLATAHAALAASRLRALAALAALLQTYSQCLTLLVRSLEAKHGVVARSLELHATDISLQAQIAEKSTELKLWKLRRQFYTPDVVSALQNYMTRLRDTRFRASDAVRALRAELERHGAAAPDTEDASGDDAQQQRGRTHRDMDQLMGDLERDADRLRVTP
ncbi:Uncharacterized protein ESCO_003708 [Escovopsis weberi]|uniref:HAUS augmin-like complex subunit 4 n=1 Tax=Escovopsis weberi TaxID=150374 RepID=A0A0M8N431_ESCWE|nr:Uncharacterized protein ESCO_003708 [Escovopsis weberi]